MLLPPKKYARKEPEPPKCMGPLCLACVGARCSCPTGRFHAAQNYMPCRDARPHDESNSSSSWWEGGDPAPDQSPSNSFLTPPRLPKKYLRCQGRAFPRAPRATADFPEHHLLRLRRRCSASFWHTNGARCSGVFNPKLGLGGRAIQQGGTQAQTGRRLPPLEAAAIFMAATSSLVAKRPLIRGRTSA